MAQGDFDPTIRVNDVILTGNIYVDKNEIDGWSITQPTPAEICEQVIANALFTLRTSKPNDRSEKDRYYAVTITELEKVLAYFTMFVLDMED